MLQKFHDSSKIRRKLELQDFMIKKCEQLKHGRKKFVTKKGRKEGRQKE